MQLADLLEDHYAIYRIDENNCRSTRTICHAPVTFAQTTAIQCVSLPFIFDGIMDDISQQYAMFGMHLAYDISRSSTTYTSVYCLCIFNPSQPSVGVSIKIKMGLGGGLAYPEESGYFTLDIQKQYILVMEVAGVSGSTVAFTATVLEMDTNGKFDEQTIDMFDIDYIYASTIPDEDPTVLSMIWWSNSSYYGTGTCRLAEPGFSDYHRVDAQVMNRLHPFHMFMGSLRNLNFTYNSYEGYKQYLLPPHDIVDGSGFDETSILDDEIDLLHDTVDAMDIVIDQLTADLITANETIADLESNWWDVFDFDGLSFDVLDDALSKVIEAGFDVIIGVFS